MVVGQSSPQRLPCQHEAAPLFGAEPGAEGAAEQRAQEVHSTLQWAAQRGRRGHGRLCLEREAGRPKQRPTGGLGNRALNTRFTTAFVVVLVTCRYADRC